MSSQNKTQHRIQLNPGHFARLQDIAASFGYLHKAGPGVGKIGSLSAFLDAIADGDILLKLSPFSPQALDKLAPTGRKDE